MREGMQAENITSDFSRSLNLQCSVPAARPPGIAIEINLANRQCEPSCMERGRWKCEVPT